MQTTSQICTKFCKNVKIIDSQYRIQNLHEKYIQMSTNMPMIGQGIKKIKGKILENFEEICSISLCASKVL